MTSPIHMTLLGLALAVLCAQALAGVDALDEPSLTVRSADLDLSKSHDVEELYRRIGVAARLVCNRGSDSWDVRRVRHGLRCFDDAVGGAVLRIDLPVLTAHHRARTRPRTG